MRAVVQRVSRARVNVVDPDGSWRETGVIGLGLCVLLGVARDDSETDVAWMAEKLAGLRVFEDVEGKMNRDVREVGGGILAVSQFTLLGDARKGRRPSFIDAMEPEGARKLYTQTCEALRRLQILVAEGEFRATMRVEITNEGPVTLLLDSRRLF